MSAMGANRRTDRLGNVTVDVTVAMRAQDFEFLTRVASAHGESVAHQVRKAIWHWMRPCDCGNK